MLLKLFRSYFCWDSRHFVDMTMQIHVETSKDNTGGWTISCSPSYFMHKTIKECKICVIFVCFKTLWNLQLFPTKPAGCVERIGSQRQQNLKTPCANIFWSMFMSFKGRSYNDSPWCVICLDLPGILRQNWTFSKMFLQLENVVDKNAFSFASCACIYFLTAIELGHPSLLGVEKS